MILARGMDRPSDFLAIASDTTAGNAQRRSIIQMFSALPATFCSAGFCLLWACLAVLAFFYRSFGFTELKMKQTTKAKVKSKMAVYAYVIILCSFLYHSLQNNKE